MAQPWLCQSPAVLPSQWAQAGTLTPCHHPSFLIPELHLTGLTLPYLSLYLLLLILSNHLWPPGRMSQFCPDSRHCQCLSPPHLWHLRFWSEVRGYCEWQGWEDGKGLLWVTMMGGMLKATLVHDKHWGWGMSSLGGAFATGGGTKGWGGRLSVEGKLYKV